MQENSDVDQLPSGSAVARLSQSLGLDVVAEGVETVEQANELTVLGYRVGQGFWFGRPMAADDIADLVLTGPAAVGSPGDQDRAVGPA